MMNLEINMYDGNKYNRESSVFKTINLEVIGYAVKVIPKEVIVRDFDESSVDDNDEYLELTYPDGTAELFGRNSYCDMFRV